MALAVGGEYDAVGAAELRLLRDCGLEDHQFVVDVGCGSGRLAVQLAALPQISYLGTDVVPELIAYSRERVCRPDWRFETVDGLTIPAERESADFVTMFSVLTHLNEQESHQLLTEAVRITKPGGCVLFSFLPEKTAAHRGPLREWVVRLLGRAVKTAYLPRSTVSDWTSVFGSVRFVEAHNIGQAVCVLTKTQSFT